MEEYFDQLLGNPLFRGIGRVELRSLLGCLSARIRQYGKQETILVAGHAAGPVGIVCTGAAQVLKEDFMGNRTILAHLGPGDLFGEAFACAGTESLPVTVAAVEPSDILFIHYRKIITTCPAACPHHSGLVENMLRVLAGKNVQLNGKLDILSKRTTREKLIAYLSEQSRLSGSASFLIPFNRQELADYLCVERSAMTTQLSRLREEGVVDFEKNRFTLHPVGEC